jgi:flagella basal body P-ring formation protein FlgA
LRNRKSDKILAATGLAGDTTPMKLRFLTAHRRLCLPALVALGMAFPVPAPAQAVTAPAMHSLADIATAAETHARTLLQDQDLADAEIKANALDGRLRLKPCEMPLETFSNDNNLRGGRVTVGVRCSGAAPWTLYVPVTVVVQTSIVLLEGPLPRGTILNESHLRLEERPLTALPAQYVTTADQVLGRELTRAVSGLTVATPNMVQARDLVAKGQDVTILATGANIQVRMAGVALQKGQQGERIDVQNSSSGRTVQAVIVDSGTVQIQL